jgi:indolepyruvate ferredoxin oxidoreductase
MGFAQKGGTVLSYVRLASRPAALNQVRIDAGRADAAIICDLVVGSDPRSLSTMGLGRTRAVASLDIQPTADFIRNRSIDFDAHARLKAIAAACGEGRVDAIEAGSLAERLLGDLVFSNMFLLGYSWQKGLAPVSLAALRRAIELNGVAVARNLEAFSLGRAAAIDPEAVRRAAGLAAAAPPAEEPFEALVARLEKHLSDYQSREYAESYSTFVRRVATRATPLAGGDRFARAVARNLFKLMAYKDEYEVARLFSDGRFREKLAAEFDGVEKLKFHLAPPLLAADLDEQGRPRKRVFGPWMADAFSLLRHFKFLRGTAFDPFLSLIHI